MYFCKVVMPNLFTLPSPPFHHEIAKAVEAPVSEVSLANFVAPRGFAKTTVSGVGGALWHIFASQEGKETRKPRFVVLISRSRGHAVNLLTTMKNIIEYSPQLRALYGYHGQATARIWREDFVVLDTGDIIVARGMRMMVRGLNVNGVRPTYIVLDDAEDEENTKTAERMEANYAWLEQAVLPSGAAGDCKIINIGTPQHQSAIVMRLMDVPEWTSHHYSAIVRDETGKERSLWPEMRSMEWLNARKKSLEDQGRVSFFYREYMCQVIGDSDQLFKPSHFEKKWEGQHIISPSNGKHYLVVGEEHIPVTVFMGIDPASSLASTADYTAIVILAVDKHGNRYLVDLFRKRVKPFDVAREIERMYHKYKPDKSQIETVGYQGMLADYFREKGLFIPGLAIKNNPRRDKTERLEGLQPMFEQGKTYWPTKKQLPQIEHLINEFLLFPRGRHDDTLDAYFYANKGAFKPYHDKPEKAALNGVPVRRKKTYNWKVE